MTEENAPNWISGFWRRIGALAIDITFLGLIGLGLGLLLEEFFVEIGAWGRLIGFSIALIYFGIMNSSIGNGQTLGKRALSLKVVNAQNGTINLINSFGRYCILGIPVFLNGAQFSTEIISSFWLYPLSLLVFGGLFSTIYLYIFNRETRQSLHDLVFGTYVVNVGVYNQSVGEIWKPHLIIVGLLGITSVLAPIFINSLVEQQPFADLLKSQEALAEIPDVGYATVSSGSNTAITSNPETVETTYISAQVFLKEDQVKNSELARELASTLVKNYSQALKKDTIQITLTYGFDIGIASKWKSHSHRFNPISFQ